MRIGHLFVQPVRGTGESHRERIRQTVEMTRLLEAVGFDVVAFAESHFSDHAASPNPLLLAAAVGQHTECIDLATGVAVLGLWHPVRLAEDIAMADQLLEGRLEVCVGYGAHPLAFDGLDVPFAERRGRHDEVLEILLLAWRGEAFAYHGTYYTIPRPIRVLPDPCREPHPRLTLSASSEASIRAAAGTDLKVFGSQSVATSSPDEQLASGHAIYLDERRRLGRDGDFWSASINRHVAVFDSTRRTGYAEQRAEVLQRSRESIALSMELRKPDHAYENGHVPVCAATDRPAGNDGVIFGTPEEVVEQVRRLRDDLGFREINFITEFGGREVSDARRTIELLGSDVLPILRKGEGEATGLAAG